MKAIAHPNPPGRLAGYLEALARQDAKAKLRSAWASIFDIDSKDTGLILQRVAELVQLIGDAQYAIERAVQDEDQSRELYLAPYKKLERVFSRINFDLPVEHVLREMDTSCIDGVRFGAHMLERLGFTGSLDDDTLSILQDEVDSLLKIVLESDLPPEAKELLTRRLETLRSTLLEIRLRGAEAVHEALDALVGAAACVREPIKNSRDKKTLLNKLRGVIDDGYKFVSMLDKVKKLSAPVINLLISGDSL